ncbi:hypothetical protein TNCV_14911 [Trichonephila clavipes]|nr:hypothetical protein TNCV_14911 [Trichonephila clavipes]
MYIVHHLKSYKSPCHIDVEGTSLSRLANVPFHSSRSQPTCARGTKHNAYFSPELPSNRTLKLKSSGCRRKKRVATSKPFSEGSHPLGLNKKFLIFYGRYNVPSGNLGDITFCYACAKLFSYHASVGVRTLQFEKRWYTPAIVNLRPTGRMQPTMPF